MHPGTDTYRLARPVQLLGSVVVVHYESRVAARILKSKEVPDPWDRGFLQQYFAPGGKDPFANHVDVVDAEGALEPERRCIVKKSTALLNRTHRRFARLVEDLDEARLAIVPKLPVEHCTVERLRGFDVVGIDREMGQARVHDSILDQPRDICHHDVGYPFTVATARFRLT